MLLYVQKIFRVAHRLQRIGGNHCQNKIHMNIIINNHIHIEINTINNHHRHHRHRHHIIVEKEWNIRAPEASLKSYEYNNGGYIPRRRGEDSTTTFSFLSEDNTIGGGDGDGHDDDEEGFETIVIPSNPKLSNYNLARRPTSNNDGCNTTTTTSTRHGTPMMMMMTTTRTATFDSRTTTPTTITTITTKQQQFRNCGLETWQRARAEWTKRTVTVVPPRLAPPTSREPMVKLLTKGGTVRMYDLPRPMNLADLIGVYKEIWDKGGN
jgi:hypothetical protein